MSNTPKIAKYRIKDEQGNYQTIHFETSMKQVVGLDSKMEEVEGLISDRYNKSETDGMFRTVADEITSVEAIAEGLNGRLTVAEGEISTLKSDLASEIARATGVEADLQSQIHGLEAGIEAINHPESGILKQSKDYTDSKIADINGVIGDLEGQLGASGAELQGKIDDLSNLVASNKAEVDGELASLEGRLVATTGRVDVLEGNVADLTAKDAELAEQIQNIKDVIAGQGNDTKVFQNVEEFKAANLQPKIGDMVYLIDEKRALIFKGLDAKAVKGIDVPGWVIFDEITNHLDLVDYAKKSEVAASVAELETKITAEVARAEGAEQALATSIEALNGVVTGHGERISVLEGTVASHGQAIEALEESTYSKEEVDAIVDEAVTAQMSYCGKVQPENKKVGHVWIELM